MSSRSSWQSLRVVLTNDDGIQAPGIAALADLLHECGFDVSVVAPHTNRSGSGAALGLVTPGQFVDIGPQVGVGRYSVPGFSVDAPPALIAHAVACGALGAPPDVLVSGINDGHNTGRAVMHSGTVGAAVTAASLGLRSIALSTASPPRERFDSAAVFGVAALSVIDRLEGAPALNINVPALDVADVSGIRHTSMVGLGINDIGYTRNGQRIEVRRVDNSGQPGLADDATALLHGEVSVTRLDSPVPGSGLSPELLGQLLDVARAIAERDPVR